MKIVLLLVAVGLCGAARAESYAEETLRSIRRNWEAQEQAGRVEAQYRSALDQANRSVDLAITQGQSSEVVNRLIDRVENLEKTGRAEVYRSQSAARVEAARTGSLMKYYAPPAPIVRAPEPRNYEPSPGISGAGSGRSVDYSRFYRGRTQPSHPSQVSGR